MKFESATENALFEFLLINVIKPIIIAITNMFHFEFEHSCIEHIFAFYFHLDSKVLLLPGDYNMVFELSEC